ncbi:MAG: hypothetical protein NTW29_21745 [Bacteroidetes bacterium]|nr:hypothetical protein [Bacteroidota bacterium]
MNFKKYLPFERFEITTRLSAGEVMNRISGKVVPKKKFRLFSFSSSPDKPYEGELSGDSFTISRIIDYRNSFLPVISGQVTSIAGKTRIKITMRLATPVTVFMAFWLGIVGVICLVMIFAGLVHFREIFQEGISPVSFIPFAMFAMGSFMVSYGFKTESKKSKASLLSIFEGEEAND